MKFYKYHGAGNDFIMIDGREGVELTTSAIAAICHRRFGIGADGLIVLETSDKYDFKMVYYNADGKEGTMCGNGGRCIVAFAEFLGLFSGSCIFEAVDGEHHAVSLGAGRISLQMIDVDTVVEEEDGIELNTGSPHLIVFVEDIDGIDVKLDGRTIRYNEKYKTHGINVNFVEVRDGKIHVRTYERGVEDETYACGTGATAAAIATYRSGKLTRESIDVTVLGGNLNVSFESDGTDYRQVFLEGPAEQVFEGYIRVSN